ncbi:MAG: DUF4230 domain-containing protein [Mobilitalea sp.]
MEKNNEITKLDFKRLFLNSLITAIIVTSVCVGIYIWEGLKREEPNKAEFSAVNQICELATLRCYYHDVAEYEKQPDGLFKYGLFQYGYKKFWIEYDGIVEIGIDVGQVQVNKPDENGVVQVYVPEAEILNINADPESMGKMVADTGKFTEITASEKAEAFSEAQTTMKSNAENDNSILTQAHNNAKELLKQYVVNVGEQMGQHYTVKWIIEPIGNTTQEE